MQKENVITISNNYLPTSLQRLPQPVEKLNLLGDASLLNEECLVSIIGSRKMTDYGKSVTRDMARALVRGGAVIVSGLALGIDGEAHKATLEAGGKTIAVLPGGLGSIYPATHYRLAEEIVAKGGLLLAEENWEVTPQRFSFIRRNRIIAALSKLVLITEAASGSGTRHTVEFGHQMGKYIATIPGDIYRPTSAYTNELIHDGCHPILSTQELLATLGLNEKLMKPQDLAENQYEEKILASLESSTDDLIKSTEMSPAEVNMHLTMLEIKGVTESINGKWRLKHI